jgi:hypothetical protein
MLLILPLGYRTSKPGVVHICNPALGRLKQGY